MANNENAIVALQLDERGDFAPDMQKILTKYGDNIKTRIGLHNYSDDQGLILLQFSGQSNSLAEFKAEVNNINSLSYKAMNLSFH
ncbi:hypothetical protein Halha_1264 [Halobacteroides halobius DSM 5150]|uniref:Iron-only hydrogenase system regulator n=1 Tax=Halobacteroides halobius (strain ATCC 35273 / DSM 5150 / MD-1) TaxID=748449 RepID=L0K9J6_HALHC|nr:hypothetical protein [Halobacteroides halobius]AGB41210.1 hypothetical protein Halha_1264 [Halobacteroides halobius DSM 5150]